MMVAQASASEAALINPSRLATLLQWVRVEACEREESEWWR